MGAISDCFAFEELSFFFCNHFSGQNFLSSFELCIPIVIMVRFTYQHIFHNI